MSTKNFTSFLCSLVALAFFGSCNVIQAVGDGETLIKGKTPDDLYKDPIDQINEPYLNLTDSIYAFWRFDETNGDTGHFAQFGPALFPSSGTVSTVTAQYGLGTDCDTYAPSNVLQQGGQNFTFDALSVSFWAKSYGSGSNQVYLELYDPNVPVSLSLGKTTGGNAFITGGGSNTLGTDLTSYEGIWTHYVFVLDNLNQTIELYIDGNKQETKTYGPVYGTFTTISVCNNQNRDSPVTGEMDSMGIWKRAITPGEVYDLYTGNNNLDQ